MAEERTLGLARALETPAEDLSKEELQRRMDEARDSISHTVTEIKETVANQYQAVKDTLDWREQFKKRPIEWSAGAVGVGFLVGYGLAAAVKGDGNDDERSNYSSAPHAYASRPIMGQSAGEVLKTTHGNGHESQEDDGPGLLERFQQTPVYERVRDEVAGIGNTFLDELSKTAKSVVVPALLKSIKDFIGGYLPANKTSATSQSASMRRDQSGLETSN